MGDKFNTISGWVLAAGIVALGGAIVSGQLFAGHAPEHGGYPVAGGAEEGGAAAEAGPPIETLLATADPAKGAEVFKKCTACHTIDQGAANGTGPNLYGTMGEAIATGHGGFAFSDALKAVGGTWTWQNMDKWLTSPRKFAPGTKMTFAGLSKPEDRANIMVYLNSKGGSLTIPAAGAAPAEGTAAPAESEKGAAALQNAAEPADGEVAPKNDTAPPRKH